MLGFPPLHPDEGHYTRRAMQVLKGMGPQESTKTYPYPYDHPYFGQLFLAAALGMVGYPHLILNPSSSSFSHSNTAVVGPYPYPRNSLLWLVLLQHHMHHQCLHVQSVPVLIRLFFELMILLIKNLIKLSSKNIIVMQIRLFQRECSIKW